MALVIRRLGLYAATLWVALTINFFLPRLMKGDAVNAILGRMQGAQVPPEAIESLRIAFGLDHEANVFADYGHYLRGAIHGDLGVSLNLYPQSVTGAIADALPWTLALVGVATLLSFVLGTGLGVLAGWKRGGWLDALPPVSMFFASMPYFWFGLIVITLFAVNVEWFPSHGGYDGVNTTIGMNGAFLASAVEHAILPIITIVIASMGQWLVGMRNMMISTLAEDHLTLAEAKGLSGSRRALNYGARNAILPSISSLSLSLGFVVSGAVVTEIIFQYPGVGFLLFQAVQNRDYALMQGIFLVITVAVLTANLLADLAYAVLDPRTRSTT